MNNKQAPPDLAAGAPAILIRDNGICARIHPRRST